MATDYSPLWDLNVGQWTDYAVQNYYRTQIKDEFTVRPGSGNIFVYSTVRLFSDETMHTEFSALVAKNPGARNLGVYLGHPGCYQPFLPLK